MEIKPLSDIEFDNLSNFIYLNFGLKINKDKSYLIESRLAPIAQKLGCKNFGELYHIIKFQPTKNLINDIIDAITTNETMWFRDVFPFKILREKIFPQYMSEVLSGKRNCINIWSAACSTGQEPYSIAITFLESLKGRHVRNIENVMKIYGTDISNSILDIAKQGKYNNFFMNRGMPTEYKEKYFTHDGKSFHIKPEVKKFIIYKQLNLLEHYNSLTKMDLVFFRNVLIYFSDEVKRVIYKKIAEKMYSSAPLFIGASESLIEYSNNFEVFKSTFGYYYRNK